MQISTDGARAPRKSRLAAEPWRVDDVPDPPVGQRYHDGVALVSLEAHMADDAFVQNTVDGLAVIGRPVGVAVHSRALGDHVAHGEHFLSGATAQAAR